MPAHQSRRAPSLSAISAIIRVLYLEEAHEKGGKRERELRRQARHAPLSRASAPLPGHLLAPAPLESLELQVSSGLLNIYLFFLVKKKGGHIFILVHQGSVEKKGSCPYGICVKLWDWVFAIGGEGLVLGGGGCNGY